MSECDISVIIPVSKDIKIKECLASVDEDVEIVVVLNNNPSPWVIEMVNADPRCVAVFIPGCECNLALVLNRGVEAATKHKVVVMNSDCIFPLGLIRKMTALLDSYEVVKSRVSFAHRSFGEHLVAQARYLFGHIFNNRQNIFGPGMSFQKDIVPKVGGYLFDEDLGWAEDGDLSMRIHGAGLTHYFTTETILHAPEKISHDLYIAGRIGRGKRVRDYKNGIGFWMGAGLLVKNILFDENKHFALALKNSGLGVAIYLALWKFCFFGGYVVLYRRISPKAKNS